MESNKFRPLPPGGGIAIISPASIVKAEYVEGAARFLRGRGYKVRVMPHAMGPACGSYAATVEERAADLLGALNDPEADVILCARGGYGCVHLLERIPLSLVREAGKAVWGFSDVSALHALWRKAGVGSLHAPMAKHLATMPADDECTRLTLELLSGSGATYTLPAAEDDMPGCATGMLVGGNLAVTSHLLGTPFDPFDRPEESILFIEDVGEATYATERMLWQLYLSGRLLRFAGIICGRFTLAGSDRNFPSTAAMIACRLRQWGYAGPFCALFPAGHEDRNLPLPLGAAATLRVTPCATSLSI